jgi:hypothetical protein
MKQFGSVNYFGKVVLKENEKEDYFTYGLYDNRTMDVEYIDLEQKLNSIYMSDDDKRVCLKIVVLNDGYRMKDNEIIYDSVGELYKRKVYGIYEWFIGDMEKEEGESLGSVLFDCVGKKVIFSLGVYN